MQADRKHRDKQKHRQTDTLIAILRPPTWRREKTKTRGSLVCSDDTTVSFVSCLVSSSDHSERNGQHAVGDHQSGRGKTKISRARLQLPALHTYNEHVRGRDLPPLQTGLPHRARTMGLAWHCPVSFPPGGRRFLPVAEAGRSAAAGAVQALSDTARQQSQRGVVLSYLRTDGESRPSPQVHVTPGVSGRAGQTVPLVSTVQASSHARHHRHGCHQGTTYIIPKLKYTIFRIG